MTPRKQPSKATAPRASQLPLPTVRRQIWEQATELVAVGDCRDVSEVLAKRFQLPQSTIVRVMVFEALRWEREAFTLRLGVRNALHLSRDAGGAVYRDTEVWLDAEAG